MYFTSLFFYNRNFELQKTVVDLRKSFHRTVTTVAQYFRMMLHLLKSDFRDQNTYLCNRKRVAKRTILRRNSARIEFFYRKTEYGFWQKAILIDSLILPSQKYWVFLLLFKESLPMSEWSRKSCEAEIGRHF